MMIPFDDRVFVSFGGIFIDVLKCTDAALWRQPRETEPSSAAGKKGEDKEEGSVNGQSVFTHETKRKKCSKRRQ